MNRVSIDLFIPLFTEDFRLPELQQFILSDAFENIFLLSRGGVAANLPEKVKCLSVTSFSSTESFELMASVASAQFVVCFSNGLPLCKAEDIECFCFSVPLASSMAYADYYKIVGGEKCEAPTIDYLAGSLRNDFDFGSVLLFRTSALKKYLSEEKVSFAYAGLYQLRLAMSRLGDIFHYKNFLYAEQELDTRKSGEKQFDYVNPAQREVQVEMEEVCTAHLKAVGAFLPPCKYTPIDLSQGVFAVEASVVIPVLNRASTIADAIGSVLEQKTTFPFNIIVVDNHSTDGTSEIIEGFASDKVVHIIPERTDLGIGGCWNEAVNSPCCGRFAVQLDSDDLYSSPYTLQNIVDGFYKQQCAMLIGSYRICDFELNTLPPGVIDHKEWSEENGRNNALRINGLGAPRAFYTPVIRSIGFPNVSYGEDYAVALQVSRNYRIGRIYDVLYLCRRWGGNSDAALSHAKVNANNFYKDSVRTAELEARLALMKENNIPSSDELAAFFDKQLGLWPSAADRYKRLAGVEVRCSDNGVSLQYNAARAVSTAAKVDGASVALRPCFLCKENRPAEQFSIDAAGSLSVLVNPYPILPCHFTLPTKKHTPQLLSEMFVDMLHLSEKWREMTIFYNGAKCGASAPDHAHLQAVRAKDVPLLGDFWENIVEETAEPLCVLPGSALYRVKGYILPLFKIVARSVSDSLVLMRSLVAALPVVENECEPRMNVLSYYSAIEGYVTFVVPRRRHRPECYGEGEGQYLVSPGALDVSGLVVTPRECDFRALTFEKVIAILQEVAYDDSALDEVCDNFILL